MRRFVVSILAVIGALTIVGSLVGFIMRRYVGDGSKSGIVLGPNKKPAVGAPVFLDHGNGAIERVVTDSLGRFTLRLNETEVRRAKWLICVPGGVPMVGYAEPGFQIGPTIYTLGALSTGKAAFIRTYAWMAPVPRECPPALDSIGWRYPVGSGHDSLELSITEPNWK